jgi:hypothetical protein
MVWAMPANSLCFFSLIFCFHAGEDTVWAMPETALGFFPGACDVRPTTPVKETYITRKGYPQTQ